jgi:hypothetical protein
MTFIRFTVIVWLISLTILAVSNGVLAWHIKLEQLKRTEKVYGTTQQVNELQESLLKLIHE